MVPHAADAVSARTRSIGRVRFVTCAFAACRFATHVRRMADFDLTRGDSGSVGSRTVTPLPQGRSGLGRGADAHGFTRSRGSGCAHPLQHVQEHAAVLPLRPGVPGVWRALVAVQPRPELLEAHGRVPLARSDRKAQVAPGSGQPTAPGLPVPSFFSGGVFSGGSFQGVARTAGQPTFGRGASPGVSSGRLFCIRLQTTQTLSPNLSARAGKDSAIAAMP